MNALHTITNNALIRPASPDCSAKPWRIETIDPLVGQDWDHAAAAAGATSVFHTAAWARLLAETYGHIPHYLKVWSGDRLLALVPIMEVDSRWTGRRGVCLPFSDGCGPLWTAAQDALTVTNALASYARFHHWKYLEIRDGYSMPSQDAASTNFETQSLDLRAGLKDLWANIDGASRRSIRKATLAKVDVSVETVPNAMAAYHSLHSLTRRRHGLPPQPLAFFMNLNRQVIEPGNGFIVLARLEGRPIAGAVFLHGRSEAIYKFGASDQRLWSLRPNHLVMWTGIKRIAEQTSCETLSFGRTWVGNSGLIRFKASFGANRRPLPYHRLPSEGRRWAVQDASIDRSFSFFRHSPLFLNEIAGAQIYRHLD